MPVKVAASLLRREGCAVLGFRSRPQGSGLPAPLLGAAPHHGERGRERALGSFCARAAALVGKPSPCLTVPGAVLNLLRKSWREPC